MHMKMPSISHVAKLITFLYATPWLVENAPSHAIMRKHMIPARYNYPGKCKKTLQQILNYAFKFFAKYKNKVDWDGNEMEEVGCDLDVCVTQLDSDPAIKKSTHICFILEKAFSIFVKSATGTKSLVRNADNLFRQISLYVANLPTLPLTVKEEKKRLKEVENEYVRSRLAEHASAGASAGVAEAAKTKSFASNENWANAGLGKVLVKPKPLSPPKSPTRKAASPKASSKSPTRKAPSPKAMGGPGGPSKPKNLSGWLKKK